MVMIRDKTLLRVVAVFFLVGGAVRLAASEPLFARVGIGVLWTDAPYFIYVYRVLGGFVFLTGLYLWSLAGLRRRMRGGVLAVEWGLILIACVMLVTGFNAGLRPQFYFPDIIFCGVVAVLLEGVQRRAGTRPLPGRRGPRRQRR